jgi:hypothetical protein
MSVPERLGQREHRSPVYPKAKIRSLPNLT